MTAHAIETDYLIIGSGAAGLAFADTLLTESDADMVIVDRLGRPGGHWNHAYSYVTLHQPSAFYGVNSMELGSGRRDAVGLNRGLHELASGAEVSGYFERLMHQRLLASGRVRYFPLSDARDDGSFDSLLTGARTEVRVRRRVVNAHRISPAVPATHTPRFEVAPGTWLLRPHELPDLWLRRGGAAGSADTRPAPPSRFVVIGGGKTAMDTCLWLMNAGAAPDAITWVVPRDSWLMNRVHTQNGPDFFHEAIGGQADFLAACAAAQSADDLFLRLEQAGVMLRIHRDVWPTMFHFATVSPAEVEALRQVRDVVRHGHVRSLRPDRMRLDGGERALPAGTLCIDCTASAVGNDARHALGSPEPVFQPGRIVLQMLRMPLISFSAALTAHVETHTADDEARNRLCRPVPFPYTLADYPRTVLANMMNQHQWNQDPALREWIRGSRLDAYGRLMASVRRDDAERQAVLARLKEQAMAAAANLPRLVAASAR